MHFLQACERFACFIDLPILRQARNVNPMTCGECRTLLQRFAAVFDRFRITPRKIMGDGKTGVENRVLRSCGLMRIASSRCFVASSD